MTLSFNSCFPLNENNHGDPGIGIKNGSATKPGQYPYLVSIQLMGIFESTHLCGGVLIDAPGGATIVLTVAYCVESYSKTLSKLSVHAGVYNLKNPDLATQQIATISKVTLHPDYNMMSLDNDIAVLHLSQPLDMSSEFVSTIETGSTSTGDKCTVLGYGDTVTTPGVIEKLAITGLPDEDCESIMYPGVSEMKFVYQPESMACGKNPHGEFCQGDQGGPLICGGKLAGIASLDISCDSHNGKPSVYTQMDYYESWIEKLTTEMVEEENEAVEEKEDQAVQEKKEAAEDKKQKKKDDEEESKQKKKDAEEENKQKKKDAEEENKQKKKDAEEENKQKKKDKEEENKQKKKDKEEENKQKKKDKEEENKQKKKDG